jgi:NAD(P)-dependent dehydrogenase (short-subunit alcohol dehydrogenase family)
MAKTWFITGATSGFGAALTDAALEHGDTVVAAVRRPETMADTAARHPGRLDVIALDVSDTGAAAAAGKEAVARHGGIDVLVNNAGKGLIGGAEEVSEDELRALFDLHLHGPIALTKAILPSMRARGRGIVLQLSSNAGRVSFPAVSAYSATKFALEGWSEALHHETRPLGVHVVILEPGAFRTRFHGSSLEFPQTRTDAYGTALDDVRSQLSKFDGVQPGDPAKAAAVLLDLVEHPEPPLRLVLGSDAFDAITQALQTELSDMADWEKVSRSTDF